MAMDFRGDPAAALLEVLIRNKIIPLAIIILRFPLIYPMLCSLRQPMRCIIFRGLCSTGWKYCISLVIRSSRSCRSRSGICCRSKRREHGLEEEQLAVEEDALLQIIREYTRESGVRNLEQQMAAICRKAAKADRR